MDNDGMKAGIGGDDFESRARRRIAVEHHGNVFLEMAKKAHAMEDAFSECVSQLFWAWRAARFAACAAVKIPRRMFTSSFASRVRANSQRSFNISLPGEP